MLRACDKEDHVTRIWSAPNSTIVAGTHHSFFVNLDLFLLSQVVFYMASWGNLLRNPSSVILATVSHMNDIKKTVDIIQKIHGLPSGILAQLLPFLLIVLVAGAPLNGAFLVWLQ